MQTMMVDYFPRIHTAIAEWLACIVFMIPLKKRLPPWQQILLYVLSFFVLMWTNRIGEEQEGFLWIVLFALGMLEMLLMIKINCSVNWIEAGYYWAHAFIAAEFAASAEWQINYYLIVSKIVQPSAQTLICMAIVYAIVFAILFVINRRVLRVRNRIRVTIQELSSVLVIVLGAFFISNFNFAFQDNLFTQLLGAGVLYSRTLVDFGGLVMMYAHDESRSVVAQGLELEAMENLLNRQYEQYRLFEENNKSLQRVYHDLKHQIDFIRSEKKEEKRDLYLKEMEQVINTYEAAVNTGSVVLDTLLTSKNLTCLQNDIVMTCYADANKMKFMDVMDVCSIFGNALDNAIECVQQIEDKDKRLIKLTVYSRNHFLLIRVENYCESLVAFDSGMPVTTKGDTQMHGYGVKSIKQTVEKYHGHLDIEQDSVWFRITALIPLPDKN